MMTPTTPPDSRCPGCGATVSARARFCTSCRRPLGGTCPRCGGPLAPAARFCQGCGTPVGDTVVPLPPPSPQPAAPIAKKRPRRAGCLAVTGILLIALIAAAAIPLVGGWPIAAWPPPDASDAAADALAWPAPELPPVPRDLTTLAQETLGPSDEIQSLVVPGAIAVSIPGGLLTTTQQVSIAAVDGLPPPDMPFGGAVLAQYDIQIGDMHQFEQPLLIAIAYDPAALDTPLPPEEALSARFWDESLGGWVTQPSLVDTANHQLIIVTSHLSTFVGVTSKSDGHWQNDCFDLFFSQADLRQQIDTGMVDRNYLETVWDALNDTALAYDAADMPRICHVSRTVASQRYVSADGLVVNLPTLSEVVVRQQVSLAGDGGLSRSKYTGAIQMPYLTVFTRAQLRLFIAHEIFHSVQATYYTAAGMTEFGIPLTSAPGALPTGIFRVWWLDSTAEYAAATIAYPDGDRPNPSMAGRRIPRYLDESLLYAPSEIYEALGGTDPQRDHAYATAWFFAFLTQRYGVDFPELFRTVASSRNPSVVAALDAALSDRCELGRGLDGCYRAFARDWLFNTASALPASPPELLPPAVAEHVRMEATATVVEHRFALKPYYTAQVLRVEVAASPGQATRMLKVEPLELPDGTTLYVDVLPGDRRSAGGANPWATFSSSSMDLNELTRSVEVAVGPGDGLYLLAVNSAGAARAVHARITEIVTPTPAGQSGAWQLIERRDRESARSTSNPACTLTQSFMDTGYSQSGGCAERPGMFGGTSPAYSYQIDASWSGLPETLRPGEPYELVLDAQATNSGTETCAIMVAILPYRWAHPDEETPGFGSVIEQVAVTNGQRVIAFTPDTPVMEGTQAQVSIAVYVTSCGDVMTDADNLALRRVYDYSASLSAP
ncbi:zinc ribbon domain-containing protein [Chloroflexales bacterium ZM16-3]|nr:zinc ribbon domain-containing protein [Chloroflexales bacterium ZM16-3]